ncbi:hypothetical protein RCL1_005714 [Eukaryota sp. TZLM3-RCL]
MVAHVDIESLTPFKFLTVAQLKAQAERCLNCEAKPCKQACPAGVSPADYIAALGNFLPSDFARAAKLILQTNPVGTCCLVCPDKFCVSACLRGKLDCPLDIPTIQATIVHRARQSDLIPAIITPEPLPQKVAIVGAGPAGLTAAQAIAQRGIPVDLFDKNEKAGGAMRLIPDIRLPTHVIDDDVNGILNNPLISFHPNTEADVSALSSTYDAVVLACGAQKERTMNIPGAETAIQAMNFLRDPKSVLTGVENVVIIGGGAVAVDCAIKTRLLNSQANISLVYRRGIMDMPVTKHERKMVLATGADIVARTVVTSIDREAKEISVVRVKMGDRSSSESTVIPHSEYKLPADLVVFALGSVPELPNVADNVFVSGDAVSGPITVVESVASGKKVAAKIIERLTGRTMVSCTSNQCQDPNCETHIPLFNMLPVPINTSTFGIPLKSPFILSAAPPTDGLNECRAAFKAGWAGVIMKTAFEGVPIHIPDGYMAFLDANTYGNCDNVSGRSLSAVCADVTILRSEFPDRLVAASTGGSMTGNDDVDRASWQKHTRMLEEAGAQLIEYSLSCPQGAEGAQGNEGTMVSQSERLTRKVISWVMETSDPNVPKLFKLTGAVTDPLFIVNAAMDVFAQYPNKKAGVTLANSFPSLDFIENKPSANGKYRQARIIGLHGKAIAPISNLALSNVATAPWKDGMIELSASGGAMDYRSSADFIALGATTVQFCTLPTKDGLSVIDTLEVGFSHYLAQRGFKNVAELQSCLRPNPPTDFMELPALKKISVINDAICIKCMNCTRCPAEAISLNDKNKLVTDPSKCIGCKICVMKCPASAMTMRNRTKKEVPLTPHM